ncbi:MAG: OmpA family protein [Rhizomicrobium sp.]
MTPFTSNTTPTTSEKTTNRLCSVRQRGFRSILSVRITIEGNCDERGTREYNLALGARRANAVKEYLVSVGVSSGRVETISYGKERPTCTEVERVLLCAEPSWCDHDHRRRELLTS